MEKSEYFMLLETLTTDLINVLNKHYPKIGCGYTNLQDELAVKYTLDRIAVINQTNLNIIFPNRDAPTVDNQGVITHDHYWDCECDDNYIHSKSDAKYCASCDSYVEDQPDSHFMEVQQHKLKLKPTFDDC